MHYSDAWKNSGASFDELVGKTLTAVDGAEQYSEVVTFTCADGIRYQQYHVQDCCENVSVEEIVGDIADLIGTPIVFAEVTSEEDKNASESGTWTFYKLATVKGHVTLRWLGSSNGYYSEDVSFVRVGGGE